jgi:hypothetical protein
MGIEKPLAPARPNSDTHDSALPIGGGVGTGSSRPNADSPLKFVLNEKDTLDKEQKIADRYKSIDSLNKADKIKALSDTNLNPYRLANPYDGLANSLHRWKTVAAQAANGHYSNEEMGKVADNYYKKMIAPMYAKMGIAPMDKELWDKQAYSEALKYNLEDSYNSSIMHGLKNGFHTGAAETDRAYGYVTDMVGNVLDNSMALYKRAHAVDKTLTTDQIKQNQNRSWIDTAKDIHNFVSGVHHDRGLVSQGASYKSDKNDFWSEALPNHEGWSEHATSFVAEQAAQLPVYVAMGLTTGGAGAAAKSTNVTEELLKTPLGKRTYGYLMAGAEGLAYGKATRRQDDKAQAWRDAVGFTVFHGLFDVGGLGLKKLINVVPESNSALLDKLKSRQDTLDLAAEGKRPATGPEIYEDHKKEIANNLTVAGITGQRAIFSDSLRHIENMQNVEHGNWSRDQVREYEQSLLKDDPARWAPVLSSAKFVRSLIGDKKLSNLTDEESKFLGSRIEKLIDDAGKEINTHSDGMKESTASSTVKNSKSLPAKSSMDLYRSKVLAQISKDNPSALQMIKPEQVDAIAAKMMAKDAQKAAEKAETVLGDDPVREATNAAKRSKVSKTEVDEGKIQASRKEDKYGSSASLKALPAETKSYFKNVASKAKENGQKLSEYFEDMEDKDFVSDLSQHFYPQALRDAKIYFESQNSFEGKQDPNFLAFMYNYTDKMPKEFAKELENRLVSTMKVQKYMNGKEPSEPQLEYFAKAMYNHMDNFLDSGRWPKESNIFRSSNEKMFQSTRWQMQLLREKMVQEQKNLKDMFSTNPKALKNAMTAYSLLSKRRLEEYKTGPKDMSSQHNIKDIGDRITEVMTQTGDRERIPF